MYREEIGYDIVENDLSPDQRRNNWEIAKGMQAVDGLSTSDYAESMAEGYIRGDYTAYDLIEAVDERYLTDNATNPSSEEADKVAARMTAALEDMGFAFSPAMLAAIHERLFQGVLSPNEAGIFRNKNLSKREPILNGESVTYGDFRSIEKTLEYDFEQERGTQYSWPFTKEDIEHLAKFTSDIWQVHPFFEGNTRTVALFLQLYLRSLGIPVNNDLFKQHSDFFRDALVKSNYANIPAGIQVDFGPLIAFFENLLTNTNHGLPPIELQ